MLNADVVGGMLSARDVDGMLSARNVDGPGIFLISESESLSARLITSVSSSISRGVLAHFFFQKS